MMMGYLAQEVINTMAQKKVMEARQRQRNLKIKSKPVDDVEWKIAFLEEAIQVEGCYYAEDASKSMKELLQYHRDIGAGKIKDERFKV